MPLLMILCSLPCLQFITVDRMSLVSPSQFKMFGQYLNWLFHSFQDAGGGGCVDKLRRLAALLLLTFVVKFVLSLCLWPSALFTDVVDLESYLPNKDGSHFPYHSETRLSRKLDKNYQKFTVKQSCSKRFKCNYQCTIPSVR
jgi:hypothetical protein